VSSCECVEVKCEEGIPAWVMTFADLMSLLLAFFVLLFSFSEMDKNVYKELAGSLKDAFGVQREIKAKETPRGINIIAREFSPGRPQPTAINEVRQVTTNESKLHPVFTDPAKEGQGNQKEKADDVEDKSFNATLSEEDLEMVSRIKRDSELLRESLGEEINQGLIDMKITGKRIILLVREKGAFPSGSAQLIKPFKVIVSKISQVFSDFDGVIIVAGHTDNIPISSYRFRSNWELSSSRAVSVIHEFIKDIVLKNKRFEIAAYADTQPVDSNNTAIGRAKNRRVEIMMDYSKNETAGHTDNDGTGNLALDQDNVSDDVKL
jgi:chemotaxis protein MotB